MQVSSQLVNFETFAIKHMTTPAYYPRSNSQAESFVDSFKRALKKSGVVNNGEEKYGNSCECIGGTINRSTTSNMFLTELMFGRIIFLTSCYKYEKSTTISRTTKLIHLMLKTRCFSSFIRRVNTLGWVVSLQKGMNDLLTS